VRHVGIKTNNPERLAEFYKFIFSMKEVDRTDDPRRESRAIYLSDGTINLGLIMNPPVPRDGLQVLGFQVNSIQQVEERLKEARGLTYKGEAPLAIEPSVFSGPYKTMSLKDPDGTHLELSAEGWAI
jgi:catechol 2,3-dioxygenase-like lactoylglutathione lyase family enzyme